MPASHPLPRSEARKLKTWFEAQPWAEAVAKPYTEFAFRVAGETLAWSYYPKKQVLVEEGKAGDKGTKIRGELASFVPSMQTPSDGVLPVAANAVRQAEAYPYAGSDESGKGDTFGPLAVGACRLDPQTEERLIKAGIQDSKKITEARIPELADAVREAAGEHCSVHLLEPPAYNRAIAEARARGGNLNTVLAELHARCFADLGGAAWLVIDKFGDDRYLRAALPPKTKFHAEHRAEAFPAVAAGSILAREACLAWFAEQSARGREFPRGSSNPSIVPLLTKIAHDEGPEALERYAKTHFATVERVINAAR